MKRMACLILTLCLMLSLTGCGEILEKLPGLIEELEDAPGLEALFPTVPDSVMPDTDDWYPSDSDAVVPDWGSLIPGFPGFTLPGMEEPSTSQAVTQPAGLWPGEDDVVETAPPSRELLPLDTDSIELVFSSGVGNWGTVMVLNRDGSFTGEFFDMNMGDAGEEYPYGTMWCCTFSGEFANFVQINEHTWSLKLAWLELDREDGETWIENGIKYIATTPYGLEDSGEFWLLMPTAPAESLPEDAVTWWPYFFYAKEDRPDTINCYALMNMESYYTFFTSIY